MPWIEKMHFTYLSTLKLFFLNNEMLTTYKTHNKIRISNLLKISYISLKSKQQRVFVVTNFYYLLEINCTERHAHMLSTQSFSDFK